MAKGGCIYILTNKHKNVLYIGVTSDLLTRIWQHKNHVYKNSFTDKYNAEYLVYYEVFESIEAAIEREKQLKKWNRTKKENLINTKNKAWRDLYDEIVNDNYSLLDQG
ncbi:MAG: GIY-YIG nuclease family protein [Chitinophagaceae bacterium]|nr:GIY-YIG nuclease family protein [Chitinophagaceae bacterium]